MIRSPVTWGRGTTSVLLIGILCAGLWDNGAAQKPDPNRKYKGRPMKELLSAGGIAALVGPKVSGRGLGIGKGKFNGRGGDAFVNDPCLDPPPDAPFPENFLRTVQSETELAVLNRPGSMGQKIVAGYNDSFGFYDNTQGLSGFSYSTDGGHSWIDAGGLPPNGPNDVYFGDPVVVVHHATAAFFYASIYLSANGYFTISVNRGRFKKAPPQTPESVPNTLCLANPDRTGVPTAPVKEQERIIWDAPVEAVLPPNLGEDNADFLDKEWLYVDQGTGVLYLTYTRFTPFGETPLELVRSFDWGQTWTDPTVIVPNLQDTFNQGTQPITTPTGRVIVSWFSRTFDINDPNFPLVSERIEEAYSDDDGKTFSSPITVANVNPQGEPPGYNRERAEILNAPFIAVDKGQDDGVQKPSDTGRPGYGRVYITYFDGKTLPSAPPYSASAEIHLSSSSNDGASWAPEVQVNSDRTSTSHVFPSVQIGKNGTVYVGWLDRRLDPDDNILTDTWAAASRNLGASFDRNTRQSDVSTSWFVRADASPNFGDYNSSDLLGFNRFVLIWADGRFRPPGGSNATPDVFFTQAKGLGGGSSEE